MTVVSSHNLIPEGIICDCGYNERYSAYVLNRWLIELEYVCPLCLDKVMIKEGRIVK
jgi:hypothetical protein